MLFRETLNVGCASYQLAKVENPVVPPIAANHPRLRWELIRV